MKVTVAMAKKFLRDHGACPAARKHFLRLVRKHKGSVRRAYGDLLARAAVEKRYEPFDDPPRARLLIAWAWILQRRNWGGHGPVYARAKGAAFKRAYSWEKVVVPLFEKGGKR